MTRRQPTPNFGKSAAPVEVTCPKCKGTGKVSPEAISIGDRFRTCREQAGKTQAEVSPALRISRAQLANLEGDRSRPGLETLMLAADTFGVSIDYLLGRR